MKILLLTLIAAMSLSSPGFTINTPINHSQEVEPRHPLHNMFQVQMLVNQLHGIFEELPPSIPTEKELEFASAWVNQLEAVKQLHQSDEASAEPLVNLIDAYKSIIEALQTEDFTNGQKAAFLQASWELLTIAIEKEKAKG